MTLDEVTFGGVYRIAQFRYVMDEGFHRECRSPGDDLSGLPEVIRKQVEAEWTPVVISAYRNRPPPPPSPPEKPDPIRTELDTIKTRLAALETVRDITRT